MAPRTRVEALTDGVFGVMLTLLVLDLKLPQVVQGFTEETLRQHLIAVLPNFFAFALTFIVGARYWLLSLRMFRQISTIDAGVVSLNLLGLFFVTLLPLSTSVVADAGDLRIGWILYTANLAALGLANNVVWRYAVRRHLLVPEVAPTLARMEAQRGLAIPGVFIGSLLLTIASVTLAQVFLPVGLIVAGLFLRDPGSEVAAVVASSDAGAASG